MPNTVSSGCGWDDTGRTCERPTSVVDQNVNASAEEVGSLFDLVLYVGHVPKVAYGGVVVWRVLLKVDIVGMLQLLFVDVEEEDLVATLQDCVQDQPS